MSRMKRRFKPMLAFPSKPFDSPDWLNEIKIDGTRVMGYIDTTKKSVELINRRGIDILYRYPELKTLYEDVKVKQVVLDGEIACFEKGKPNFQKLQEREHVDDPVRIELLSKNMPVTYIVFDVLHVDGKDLVDKPLIERKKILERVVSESSRVLISRYVIGNGKNFFQKVRKKGLEGIMSKKLDSPYIQERSKYWLKIKALKTLDCVICGFTSGRGKRSELLGSLIAGCYYQNKLKYVGKIGTGFSEKQLKELLERLEKLKVKKCPFPEEPELKLPPGRKPVWTKPKLVCEVKFLELTEDKIMRAPSFIRLRNDKIPKECILES